MLDVNKLRDDQAFFEEKMHVTLDAARCLINNRFLNDSLNRLYYATMYAAKTLLLTKNVEVKTHQATIRQFGLYFRKTGIVENAVGKSLSDLSKIRTKADYDAGFAVTENEAKKFQQDAEKFVEMADKLLQEMDKEKVNITSGQG